MSEKWSNLVLYLDQDSILVDDPIDLMEMILVSLGARNMRSDLGQETTSDGVVEVDWNRSTARSFLRRVGEHSLFVFRFSSNESYRSRNRTLSTHLPVLFSSFLGTVVTTKPAVGLVVINPSFTETGVLEYVSELVQKGDIDQLIDLDYSLLWVRDMSIGHMDHEKDFFEMNRGTVFYGGSRDQKIWY